MKTIHSDVQLRVLEKEAISCQDVTRLLGDYKDKEIPATLKARLDSHICHCSECQQMQASYNWVVDLAAEIQDKPVSTEIHNRLRQALNAKLGLQLSLSVHEG